MLTDSPAWKNLETLYQDTKHTHLSDFYTMADDRNTDFSITHDGLTLNYAKTHIDHAIRNALIDMATQQGVEDWRDKMFAGNKINNTEDRAVLHVALRAQNDETYTVDGRNVVPDVHDTLDRMERFVNAVHKGDWTGYRGNKIKRVINIGIGGSDLGPAMVTQALRPYHHEGIETYFVSNIDAADLTAALDGADADTTLFLIASKTFTTQETMENARSAKQWFLSQEDATADDISKHFIALSTNEDAVTAFGIPADNMFPFADWVGGRFSLWSSIGLSIALSIGFQNFRALLAGARSMDHHFKSAPLRDNMPVMLALIGVWHRNFRNYGSLAILPYSQYLKRFPAFLQQLDMESNGKSVNRDGQTITHDTSPVLFGEPGTNGQHAFYQMLHQGTDIVPCDFIAALSPIAHYEEHHHKLLANMFAQTTALMDGRQTPDHPHRNFDGNRPSNLLLCEDLSPHHLGMLIALYEHKIFVQGIIWELNSFDQWGVELGKSLTKSLLEKIALGKKTKHDISVEDYL